MPFDRIEVVLTVFGSDYSTVWLSKICSSKNSVDNKF